MLPALLPPDRVASDEAALVAAAARAGSSRDDRPVSFLHALARRQQATAGPWGRLVAAAGRVPAAGPGGPGAPSLDPRPRAPVDRPRPERAAGGAAASHGVAVVGAAGMGWWLLLLFSFQTHAGALYGWLGALAAAFMLGLALGATLAPRAAFAEGGRDVASQPGSVRGLRLALGAAAAFAVLLPWTLPAAARASAGSLLAALVSHGALLLAAGVVTGGVFPLAAEVRLAAGDGPGEAAGRLETADHVGAAVAALAGAVCSCPGSGSSARRGSWPRSSRRLSPRPPRA